MGEQASAHLRIVILGPTANWRTRIAALQAADVDGLDPDKALEADAVAREPHRQYAKTSDTRRLLTGEQFQLWKSLSEPTSVSVSRRPKLSNPIQTCLPFEALTTVRASVTGSGKCLVAAYRPKRSIPKPLAFLTAP
jgi:hypothetical protein